MTFLSSWRLVFLVAPLALLVAYLLVQRRRHVQVLRFTSVDLLDSVAPKRQGWQRHLPAVGTLLALVVLTVAFAQPALAERQPRPGATILLTLDTSGSMDATDVSPSRLAAAEQKARAFVSGLPQGVRVGLVTFASTAQLQVPPTTDRSTVLGALGTLETGGGTATASGIRTALAALSGVPKPANNSTKPTAVIVLMSDGTPTIGDGTLDPVAAADAAAAEAKQANVPIDTIAFGTAGGTVNVQGQDVPVPYDPQSMAQIAQASGGQSFTAQSGSQLGSIYDQIGRTVAYVVHTRELTAAFAGLALMLALAAAAAALVWTQRLV